MEYSLLYVSRVAIDASRRDAEIASIIARSHAYNTSVAVTGGLVRAKDWFAQLLEGSTEAVETLMQRIERDPRHYDVTVLRVTRRNNRQLQRWSMAYSGEWQYMARNIADLFGSGLAKDTHRIDCLERVIVDFAFA